MFSIGSVCVKTAGRDAGRYCVVIEDINDTFVIVDGQARRKKCNKKHLEPLNKAVKITKNSSHEDVVNAMKSIGINVMVASQKKKDGRKGEKPVKKHKMEKEEEKKAGAGKEKGKEKKEKGKGKTEKI